jgi:hypothetical protein
MAEKLKPWAVAALLVLLLALSGERECELRRRLEFESAFAEAVSYEAQIALERAGHEQQEP